MGQVVRTHTYTLTPLIIKNYRISWKRKTCLVEFVYTFAMVRAEIFKK